MNEASRATATRRLLRRLVAPTTLAVISLLFASLGAGLGSSIYDFGPLTLCTPRRVVSHGGGAISAALPLVLVVGLAASFVIPFAGRAGRAPRLRLGCYLVGAVTLGLGLVLVAIDHAREVSSDIGGDCGTQTNHFQFLYPWWGLALAVLLIQFLRAWRATRIDALPRQPAE